MTHDAAGIPSAFYQSKGTTGQLSHDMIVNRLTNQGVDPSMASQIASDISGKGQFVPTEGFGIVGGKQIGPSGMYNPSAPMPPHEALNAAQALADEGLAPSMFRGDQFQQYDAVKQALRGGFTEQGIDPAVEFMGKYGNDPNLARMGAQITHDLGPQNMRGGFPRPTSMGSASNFDPIGQIPPDMTGITNRMLGIGPKTATPKPTTSNIPSAAAIGRGGYLASEDRRRNGL